MFTQQYASDHEARDHEENVHADKAARHLAQPGVEEHNEQNGNTPQPGDIGPEVAGPLYIRCAVR
jgi:hypothetical protein